MRHVRVWMIGLAGLAVGCLAAGSVSGPQRKCVGAFHVERGRAGVPINVPIESRFTTRMPGSVVPVTKDGRLVKPPRPQVLTRDAKGNMLVDGKSAAKAEEREGHEEDAAKWEPLGIFRVWDDGELEELHLNRAAGKTWWASVE